MTASSLLCRLWWTGGLHNKVQCYTVQFPLLPFFNAFVCVHMCVFVLTRVYNHACVFKSAHECLYALVWIAVRVFKIVHARVRCKHYTAIDTDVFKKEKQVVVSVVLTSLEIFPANHSLRTRRSYWGKTVWNVRCNRSHLRTLAFITPG